MLSSAKTVIGRILFWLCCSLWLDGQSIKFALYLIQQMRDKSIHSHREPMILRNQSCEFWLPRVQKISHQFIKNFGCALNQTWIAGSQSRCSSTELDGPGQSSGLFWKQSKFVVTYILCRIKVVDTNRVLSYKVRSGYYIAYDIPVLI